VLSGVWTHVAATVDQRKHKASFYINGEKAGKAADFAAATPSVNYQLLLGARAVGGGALDTTAALGQLGLPAVRLFG
jgi:hypothetical protein